MCGGGGGCIIFQTLSLKAHDILKYVYGRRINSLESIGLQSRGGCVASIVAAVRGQRGTCSAMGPSFSTKFMPKIASSWGGRVKKNG